MDKRNEDVDLEIISVEDYRNDVYEKKHMLGEGCGSSILYLDKELIKALKGGMVLAFNDGEYCNFVVMGETLGGA